MSTEWEYISDKGTTYSIRVLPKWAQRTIRHLFDDRAATRSNIERIEAALYEQRRRTQMLYDAAEAALEALQLTGGVFDTSDEQAKLRAALAMARGEAAR